MAIKKRVGLNIPILIGFADGRQILIRIYNDKSDMTKGPGMLISKNTPLSRAIIGKYSGEVVEYFVNEKNNKIRILEIY